MSSGCTSDLLKKPKSWELLSSKGRESYTKMSAFLADPSAVERLKADEQQRCAVNSALNALKVIGSCEAAAETQQQKMSSVGKAEERVRSSATSAFLPSAPSPAIATSASSQPPPSASALQLIAGLASAAGEFGSHTPIGTLLRKTNGSNASNGPISAKNLSSSINKSGTSVLLINI